VNGNASFSITRDPGGTGETVLDESISGWSRKHIDQTVSLDPGVYRFDASVSAGMPDWYDEDSLGRVVFYVPGPATLTMLGILPVLTSHRRR
ncbi:MAG: hypothetical protein K8E66_13175, partial [Phycisphaerales bacterium]|nr:hypothetical protein [Phycisphaerales bacterium]